LAATDTAEASASPHQVVVDGLASQLGAAMVGSEVRADDAWVRVAPESWAKAGEACRAAGFDYFCFLSGIDWMPATAPNPEAGAEMGEVGDEKPSGEATDDEAGGQTEAEAVVEPDQPAEEVGDEPGGWKTGVAGGDTRFQVLARLYSTTQKLGITLKADLDEANPTVDTWSSLYAGADWHEREAWEMYGFQFAGHPNLIHMYLPGEFEGFPLRKDFPLLSREVKPWPGLVDVEPMPEQPEDTPEATSEPAPEATSEPAPEATSEPEVP